jgi:hypothetical protein
MSEIHANSIYVQEKHHPFYWIPRELWERQRVFLLVALINL